MKFNERYVQGVLMRWAYWDKHHEIMIPNVHFYTSSFELDMISVTRAGLVHEYEIKISLSDYKRDFEKQCKHQLLKLGSNRYTPSYFWYAVAGFNLEAKDVPEYAGLIKIIDEWPWVNVIKDAPRLHNNKISQKQILQLARCLSIRLSNIYHEEVKARRDARD